MQIELYFELALFVIHDPIFTYHFFQWSNIYRKLVAQDIHHVTDDDMSDVSFKSLLNNLCNNKIKLFIIFVLSMWHHM